MAGEVMVRTYEGSNQREAVLLYAEDAPNQASEGWVPIAQTWASGEWPSSSYLIATILVIAGIGILLLIVMAMYKPSRTLIVTYERRNGLTPDG